MKIKKLLLTLLICLPIGLSAQLSYDEMSQCYVGMKKSEVEKLLQKNAVRQGVSFNLEDYRLHDFEKLDIPPELQLNKDNTEAYDIKGNQFVLHNGIISILSLSTEYLDEGWDNLIDHFTAKYGKGTSKDYYCYWLADDAFLALHKTPSKVNLNALRRDLFPMKYLAKLEGREDEEEKYGDGEVISVDDIAVIREPYLSFDFYNKLNMHVSKKEFTEFVKNHNISPQFNLKDHEVTLDETELLILDTKNKHYSKYEMYESNFFFHEDTYIGGVYKITTPSEARLVELIDNIDDKYGPHKVLSSNKKVNIWIDEKLLITLENHSDYTTLKIVDRNYLSPYAMKNIKKELKEVESDFSLIEIFSLDLFSPKEALVEAIKKTTGSTHFDLELNKQDASELDLPKRLSSDYDKLEAYKWNGLAFVFLENKLNLIFMDERSSSDAEYEKTKLELGEKYGKPSNLDGHAVIWLNDKAFLILIYSNEGIGLAMVNKAWLSETELKEIETLIKENN